MKCLDPVSFEPTTMFFMVSCHECSINLATTLVKPTHPTTCSRSSNAAAGCHTSSGTINETRCAWEVSLWWKESTRKTYWWWVVYRNWGGGLNKSFPKKKICRQIQRQTSLYVVSSRRSIGFFSNFWIQLVTGNWGMNRACKSEL